MKPPDLDALATLTVSRDGLSQEALAHVLHLLGDRWSVKPVTLELHTHDAKAITVIDLVYAARLEPWIRANLN